MSLFEVTRTEVSFAQIHAQDRDSAMEIARTLPDSYFEQDEDMGILEIEYMGEQSVCIENCTSCLDTKCIFHETNRDTDEYKEMVRELQEIYFNLPCLEWREK